MIFFVGNDGTVSKSVPSSVIQGADNANNIYLIAPFAANLAATVAFRLANGVLTEAYPMAQLNEIPNLVNKQSGLPYSGWSFTLPNEITQYFGTVTAQFFFTLPDHKTVATTYTSFTVGRGVPAILPPAPTDDVYERILSNLSALQRDLVNGFYSARSMSPYNSSKYYNGNELVFYPLKGTYGSIIKSLVGNNNKPPYVDGEINAQYWQEEVDFNVLNELYTLKGDITEAVTAANEYANKAAASAAQADITAEHVDEQEKAAYQSALKAEIAAMHIESQSQYLDDIKTGDVAVPNAVKDGAGNNIAEQFAAVSTDIEGIREDITNEAHFRGYLETNAEIQALSGTPNDYAYSAQSGTVWIYQTATGWTNSGKPVPDQITPKGTAIPLMDGTGSAGTANEYAPIDHRHPTDTTRASTAVATQSANGLMSAADKTKLDGLGIGNVTGVKGAAETAYRTGNVNLTAENIGAVSINDIPNQYNLIFATGLSNRIIKLGTFPVNNENNKASLVVSGSIGGWASGDKYIIDIVISNRDGWTVGGFSNADPSWFGFCHDSNRNVYLYLKREYTETNLKLTAFEADLARTNTDAAYSSQTEITQDISTVGNSVHIALVDIGGSGEAGSSGYISRSNITFGDTAKPGHLVIDRWAGMKDGVYINELGFWEIVGHDGNGLYLTGRGYYDLDVPNASTSQVGLVKYSSAFSSPITSNGTTNSNYTLLTTIPAVDVPRILTVYGEETAAHGGLIISISNTMSNTSWSHTPTNNELARTEGEQGYWGAQYLCCSTLIPAGQPVYIWGRYIKNVRCFAESIFI